MRIFIWASSSDTIPEKYKIDCENLIKFVLKDNDLVFWAYDKGLMWIAYNVDAILILPWWFGSLYEFFTANYCKICNEIKIPVILYNSYGYYDKLVSFIDDAENLGFIKKKEKWNYYIANNVNEVMKYLKI